MTGSIYKYFTDLEEIGGDMVFHIKALEIYMVFQPIIEDEKITEGESFNPIFFWILHCYSLESKKDIISADWKSRKLTIALSVNMPIHYTDLKQRSIRETIVNYLEFQNYRTFKHLMILREQYQEMLTAALSPLKKGGEDPEIDYKAKYDCGAYADKILERIQQYEQKIKDDNTDLKDAIKDVEAKHERRMGTGMSVDTSVFIKG